MGRESMVGGLIFAVFVYGILLTGVLLGECLARFYLMPYKDENIEESEG